MMTRYWRAALLAMGMALTGIDTASAAETHLEVGNETGQIQNQELSAGPIKVLVNYEPIDFDQPGPQENNLQVQLFHNGKPYLTATETAYYFGRVDLLDLDNNGAPEVVLQAFTGGAHCCIATTTYTWDESRFRAIPFAPLDGGGGEFKDLNQDGQIEFVSADNAFFYAFSSYAGSFPPSVILNFRDGQYVDTTPEFRDYLKSIAWQMFQAYQEQGSNQPDLNGLLAGYVAQKIRLGEYVDGWNFMLAHYSKTDDWGLARYDENGNEIGQYRDFPAALRGFLTELGYLDNQGFPYANVDRSPVETP